MAQMTISMAQMTISMAQLTISVAQMTIFMAQMTISVVQMTIFMAQMTNLMAQMANSYGTIDHSCGTIDHSCGNTTASRGTGTTSAAVLVYRQQQTASANPIGTAGSSPGLIYPMMPNYMSQLVQNARLLEGVLIAPYIQPSMNARAANFDMLRQIVANSPIFANNPELREQMINALPAAIEQMRNSEVQSLMQNRKARTAIIQIQKGLQCLHIGLQRLHIAAPNLFQAGGLVAGLRFIPTGLASPAAATSGSTNSPLTSSTSITTTGQTPSSTAGTASTPSSTDPNNYAHVFAQILNMMPNQNISLLSLLHGNADVERGYSENAALITDDRSSLSDISINGLRATKDAVKFYGQGKVHKVPICKGLLDNVEKPHSRYQVDQEITQRILEKKKRL
ncbi:unnamed protein product [Rotaria socialis]|uniref:Uncharacterized protein n=2 Tax=Rotaria socialis TaxID=392032 RepID=A0A818NSZ1_9BILA|nr:unnamed protein product [Rotaria socialis]